jgi:hypothetical protein
MVNVVVPEGLWIYPPASLGGVPVPVGGTEAVVVLGVVIGVALELELEAVPGKHWE